MDAKLWFSDAFHYIEYCQMYYPLKADRLILKTLIHDITGMHNDHPDFVPQVSGYTRRYWTKYEKWKRRFA